MPRKGPSQPHEGPQMALPIRWVPDVLKGPAKGYKPARCGHRTGPWGKLGWSELEVPPRKFLIKLETALRPYVSLLFRLSRSLLGYVSC